MFSALHFEMGFNSGAVLKVASVFFELSSPRIACSTILYFEEWSRLSNKYSVAFLEMFKTAIGERSCELLLNTVRRNPSNRSARDIDHDSSPPRIDVLSCIRDRHVPAGVV